MQAVAALDPTRRDDVYWAGRLTLCGTDDDLARYDAAFRAYFGDRPGTLVRRQRLSKPVLRIVAGRRPRRRRPARAAATSTTGAGRGQQRSSSCATATSPG